MGHAAVYSCPTGSTLSSTTASGSTSTTSAASPQCPSGYALRGTAGAYYCYLSFGVGSTTTSPTYSCPSGQTLSGSGATSSCLQTLYNSATLVKSSGCPAGYDTTATQCLLSASKVDTAGITTTKTDRQLDFAYGPEHQRITSQVSLSSAVPSTLHAGTTWYLHSSGSGEGQQPVL